MVAAGCGEGPPPGRTPAAADAGDAADAADLASAELPACLDPEAAAAPALRAWLERLTGEQAVVVDGRPVRIGERASASGRAWARALLRAEYEALGYAVREEPFELPVEGATQTGVNLVADRPGALPAVILVGAHYDTVPGVPGADDNASGLVAALAAARALRGCPLPRGLRLVAFDLEELGLLGSRAHVLALRSAGRTDEVEAMVNLDMLGYDGNGDGRVTVFDCGRAGSAPLADALLDLTRRLPLGLVPDRRCADGGDHRTFWDARIPALAFGEPFGRGESDVNPCYHRACDRLDRLDLGYLSRLSLLGAVAVLRLSEGASPPW